MFKFPFKFNLIPSGEKFLTYLEQMAGKASACAHHLQNFVGTTDEAIRQKSVQEILSSRARAKALMAEISRELSRSFVTPFDREDIQDLAAELYKIPKTIEKVQDRLSRYKLQDEQGDFSRQIAVIVQEADAMDSMVQDLIRGRNNRKIQDQVAFLYDLEQRGDTILGDLLANLFQGACDPRDLILRKDIYDMLEKVIDRYRNAAGIVLQIVLKHC
ncbi:MAG: DUF47 domain-containing protein [Dongiaceae bacterium]